jgi:hypothetical protein
MKLDYLKVCSELLGDLPKRDKEIIWRRFGLDGGERETLQVIGEDYGLTRERVRQIQESALEKIEPKLKKYDNIREHFLNHFFSSGGLKREDLVLTSLGGEKFKNPVFFLLNVMNPFLRFKENEFYHSFWTIEPRYFNFAKKVIDSFENFLKRRKEPFKIEDLSPHQIFKKDLEKNPINILSLEAVRNFLEVSKKIKRNQEGFFGFREWPEINPRRIGDQAYLVFKRENKPLHFVQVAKLIGNNCNIKSCHNELIRDKRFVLIGRGIYALREWGYLPGTVKELIFQILVKARGPLSKEQIIERVLKQRLVKTNTILLSLKDKNYFLQTKEGKYILSNRKKEIITS